MEISDALVRHLETLSVDTGPLRDRADALRREGQTVMFVAIDGRPAGLVGVSDPVKTTTVEAIKALHAEGIKVVMLTGDNRTTAEAVGRKLGIDVVEAEVLPEDKSRIVTRLKSEGRVVAMAGDGVNDAPALAAADVGVAMGSGTDVAIESAGVTLLHGDLTGIVRARAVSRATMNGVISSDFSRTSMTSWAVTWNDGMFTLWPLTLKWPWTTSWRAWRRVRAKPAR